MWHVAANSREEHAKPWRSQVPPDNGFSLLCCTAAWICMRRVTFFYYCCYVRCCCYCYVITTSFPFMCHTCCCWYYVTCCCCCYVTAATVSFLCHLLLLVLCYLLLNSTASVLLNLTTTCIPCRTDTKENGYSTCKSRSYYWRTWRPRWWGPRRCLRWRTWCSGGIQRMPYQPQERTEWNCKRSSSKYNMTIYS